MVDRAWIDAVNAASGTPAFGDAPGEAAGGISLSATGVGYADSSIESDFDGARVDDDVVPAYILSELKAGFQIGAVLFLPFLLVDLVVASITTSIGMMQLPPVVISTPLKILLFVMVDGWNLLADQLIKSF
jgi:hypothetical protein